MSLISRRLLLLALIFGTDSDDLQVFYHYLDRVVDFEF